MATLEQDALSLQRISYILDTKASTDTATSDTAGVLKLYDSAGRNSDGTMAQKAISIALDTKLDSDATALSADKLSTSQNVIVDLASTDTATFNGTASIAAGVTGTLPVKNGGTGQNNLDNVTVGAAVHDNSGNVISDTYVTKSELSGMFHSTAPRYGYRIRKDEADPYERVEYIFDAVGMKPAKMIYTSTTQTVTDESTGETSTVTIPAHFDYGDWQDVWFVKDNKPCMLKSDGTVDYYLDPNNYALRESPYTDTVVVDEETGETDTVVISDSDVANASYDGNAMAQIPLVWVKRYEDDEYLYEIVCPVQFDDTYKAYAHTDASGNIKDYCYRSLFGASGNSTKLRSLSGKALAGSLTRANMVTGVTANGSGWYTDYHSQHELLRTLLVLIGKSFNTNAVFGGGNQKGSVFNSGTLMKAGQFFGYNDTAHQVKVFHMEGLWGDQWLLIAGLVYNMGNVYIKMTPEGSGYRLSDTNGYSFIGAIARGWFTDAYCNDFGLIPKKAGGSSTTYFCGTWDGYTTIYTWAIMGGACNNFPTLGILSFWTKTSEKYFSHGCALTFV